MTITYELPTLHTYRRCPLLLSLQQQDHCSYYLRGFPHRLIAKGHTRKFTDLSGILDLPFSTSLSVVVYSRKSLLLIP